ncbi:outer membrane protein transport protein [Geotalea sp. SG265]|uniref:OmpP1/FadL family transporter n=1 Tax=Geotalea sp. SG265 TaxID=2922867 RepID=UPI001FB044E1|nr:outer membrane protein transport protein [Geotalea sp. SG265]
MKGAHGALVALAGLVLILYGNPAAGAGVAITEQSIKGLGTAFAGSAAAAEDASTIFFNPAGLSRLEHSQFVGGINVAVPSAKFRNHGSTLANGQALTGGEGGDAGSAVVIPNLYYSQRINDRLVAGLGVFSPFGLNTTYNADWVGRYHAVRSELTSLNLNPVVACRLNDKLSVAAGFNAQYLKATLSNAIDFGTIFAFAGVAGVTPQSMDGYVTFRADNWSWGYNLGALYELTPGTRVGVAYRSRVRHTLSGSADFDRVPALNPTPRFVDTGITSTVTMPDSVTMGIRHNLSSQMAAVADITWTNWSTIDELRIRFDNPAETDAVTTVHWRDTFRYSIGGIYMPGLWTFRMGAAYDQSPVPDAANATPRVPDSDRIWLAAGLGYKFNKGISVDAGYAHLFFTEGEIKKEAAGENLLRGALAGSYESSVNIFSAAVSWTF